jgi:orotate phosphoribosyltransferase
MLLLVLQQVHWNRILVAEELGILCMFVQNQKTWKTKSSRRFLQKGQNVVVIEDLISTGNTVAYKLKL